jgi:hypothetical protein
MYDLPTHNEKRTEELTEYVNLRRLTKETTTTKPVSQKKKKKIPRPMLERGGKW